MAQCIVCGKDFNPKNYWQKYCGISCKQAMWALNKFKDKNVLKKKLESLLKEIEMEEKTQ